MTKKELVEYLDMYPDDTEVYIDILNDDEYAHDNKWLSDVRRPIEYPNIVRPKYRRIKGDKIAQRAHKDSAGAKKCIVL